MINYAELNAQKIFDIVCENLFKQGQRCVDERDKCVYRGPNGLKCAVGFLINDEDYDPVMNPYTAWELGTKDRFKENRFVKEVAKHHKDLLSQIQAIHDNPLNWEREYVMKSKLIKIADKFSLSAKILNDLHFPKKDIL